MNTDRYSHENDHTPFHGSLMVMDNTLFTNNTVFTNNDDEDHAIEDDPELQP